MTDAQRLHALERDVREMALMTTGPLADTERLRAIAARLVEPRGDRAASPEAKP